MSSKNVSLVFFLFSIQFNSLFKLNISSSGYTMTIDACWKLTKLDKFFGDYYVM